MAVINLLDKSVAELIAAGEVIERPASVIKELVENSIDAGATQITVEIKSGGIAFMRVTDNGVGMEKEDIPTAFLRHATSKVKNVADLDNILTMGFRGEALASISAVARVELITKRAENEFASFYKISGSIEEDIGDTGAPDGTSIMIKDLFYNTPARLKFLKKDITEGNYVQGVVDRLALSHPEVSFRFIRDGKQVRVTSGDGKYYSAIYSVFGKQFAASLIPVDFSVNGIDIKGHISAPVFTRANRSMQYFFINSRSIKNTTCIAALEEGYRNSIMVGKFPACILHIFLSANEVDVNVSPSKTDVRFANDKVVFNAIYLAVKNAILNSSNSRNINPDVIKKEDERDNNITTLIADSDEAATVPVTRTEIVSRNFRPNTSSEAPMQLRDFPVANKNIDTDILTKNDVDYSPEVKSEMNSQSGIITDDYLAGLVPPPPKASEYKQSFYTDKSEEPEVANPFKYIDKRSFAKMSEQQNLTAAVIKDEEKEPPLKFIGEIFKTYILCEHGDEIVLIDKHAAHEKIRFEKLKKELTGNSQILADSVKVKLSTEEYSAVSDFANDLYDIGMEIIPCGDNTVEITALPTMVDHEDERVLVEGIAAALLENNGHTKEELFYDILHSMACKSAIKANDDTSDFELAALAEMVWCDKNIRYCPHGRPIIAVISKYNLEKQFGRV